MFAFHAGTVSSPTQRACLLPQTETLCVACTLACGFIFLLRGELRVFTCTEHRCYLRILRAVGHVPNRLPAHLLPTSNAMHKPGHQEEQTRTLFDAYSPTRLLIPRMELFRALCRLRDFSRESCAIWVNNISFCVRLVLRLLLRCFNITCGLRSISLVPAVICAFHLAP